MSKHRTYLLVISENERRGRRFVTLRDESLMAWFRRNWTRSDEERAEELRGDVYGLEAVFEYAEGAPPKTDLELVRWIDRNVYAEEDAVVRLHYMRIDTDDDEVPIIWFMFDDHFLAERSARDELPNPRRDADRENLLDDDHDEDADEDDVAGDEDDDERGDDAYSKFFRSRFTAK